MDRFNFMVRSKEDLVNAVLQFGFVPLFSNSIPGFSVEEHVAPSAWFSSEEGVWEWKGPVIRQTGCAYGKLFEKKAVFVSMEWYPDLANLRRDGYDFDARFDDGLAAYGDKVLYELLQANSPLRSRALKRLGGYGKQGVHGFDTAINRLQGQCYAVISDFVYEQDRLGRPYGWGVAEYATPEQHFGSAFTDKVYQRYPEESFQRLFQHLRDILPDAPEQSLARLLRKL